MIHLTRLQSCGSRRPKLFECCVSAMKLMSFRHFRKIPCHVITFASLGCASQKTVHQPDAKCTKSRSAAKFPQSF